MLPPSPPTDPDVPDYSIRFFTGELRWRRHMDVGVGHSLVEDRFLARSAIHWRFVDQFAESMSPPVFPANGSLRATPPFPPSGPAEHGSPLSQVL